MDLSSSPRSRKNRVSKKTGKVPKFKICSQCKEEKPLSGFYSDKSRGHCKKCIGENAHNWQKENKERAVANRRRHHLLKTYGISLEQYEELLNRQQGCCAICERHYSEFKTRLAIDHNHFTGEIRGLLCTYCNHRVIGRHRDGELLRKMANYVDGGTGWFVPKKPRKRKKRNRK